MNKILKYASLLFAAAMLAASCEPANIETPTPDEPENEKPNPNPEGEKDEPITGTLTLSADKLIIQAASEDFATLVVKLDDKVITKDVVFHDSKAGDAVVAIEDFKFKPAETGEYSLWAEYKTLMTGNVNITAVATPVPEGSNENAEPIYAKATTTVNVRASDSEQADKVDKVTGGTKLEVLEQKVNGWSKVKIGKTEGYIKSEFLQLLNVASNEAVIGTVTATSNVNVRMAASETADRLGVLAGGEVVDLLGRENGWCKINYNGQIGYVKEDFVQ